MWVKPLIYLFLTKDRGEILKEQLLLKVLENTN